MQESVIDTTADSNCVGTPPTVPTATITRPTSAELSVPPPIENVVLPWVRYP